MFFVPSLKKNRAIFVLSLQLLMQLSVSSNASEAEETYHLSIPSQPLGEALLVFSERIDRAFFIRSSLAEDLTSKALNGEYTVMQALETLLADTDLKGEFTSSGRIKITRRHGYINDDFQPEITVEKLDIEELVVTGTRYAWMSSLNMKKNSFHIGDYLTESDISRLPDGNIGDAIQRISGVQIERRNGDGTRFRIRGREKNLALYNGEAFLTGMEVFQLGLSEQKYEDSLETLPIELLKTIEVTKSVTAADIEGAEGGTINFISRDPFDIEDYDFTTAIKYDYGLQAKKERPEVFIGLGKNFDDQISALMNVVYSERTMHMDLAENYASDNAEDDPGFTLVRAHETDKNINFIAPTYVSLKDIEQTRVQYGLVLNLGWRASEKSETHFEWLSTKSHLTQRDYEILFGSIVRYGQDIHLNNINKIPFLAQSNFIGDDVIYRTTGDTFKTQSNSYNINNHYDINKRTFVKSKFSYNKAEFNEDVGSADLLDPVASFNFPLWIGTSPFPSPLGFDIESASGWTNYGLTCTECIKTTHHHDLQYNIDIQTPIQILDDSKSINTTSETLGALSRAKGVQTIQELASIRSDLSAYVDNNEKLRLNVGLRLESRRTEFKQHRYLTDFSSTKNVGLPTQFDSTGNILYPSTFSPDAIGTHDHVGIALASYSDLCGNGGILAGSPCDINDDGIDDNLPIGPWVYQIAPHEQDEIYTRRGLRQLEPYLYGQRFRNNLPGYMPWLSYDQAPQNYQVLDDFFASGRLNSQHAHFINGSHIVDDVEKWISNVAPNSRTKAFTVPRESWETHQTSLAAYFQITYEFDHLPITVNTGIRVVRNNQSVDRNILATGSGVSKTLEDWYTSGIGTGWKTHKAKYSFTNYLPSANLIWDFHKLWKLRFATSKTISYPSPIDMGKGESPSYEENLGTITATQLSTGNPRLEPISIRQYDTSLEFYPSSRSFLQLNVFSKTLDGLIERELIFADVLDETEQGFTKVPVELPLNTGKSIYQGIEFSGQLTSAFGVGAAFNASLNKSKTDMHKLSHLKRKESGASSRSLNFTAFYERRWVNILLSYSWRDKYVSPYSNSYDVIFDDESAEIYSLTRISDSHHQWDAKFIYEISSKLNTSLDVINITKERQNTYLEYPNNTASSALWEPRVKLGIEWKL